MGTLSNPNAVSLKESESGSGGKNASKFGF